MTTADIDTSAAMKRPLDEPEFRCLRRLGRRDGISLFATPLLETELRRTAHRARLAQAVVTAVLDGIAIYDRRLTEAAGPVGVTVVAPR